MMLQTLADLFLPPGLLESDPDKKLGTFVPSSIIQQIPEQERAELAAIVQRQLLGSVFGGDRGATFQGLQKGLTGYVDNRRALDDRRRTAEILAGDGGALSPAQTALLAGAQQGSVGPTQANATRAATMPPPTLRDRMIGQYQQLMRAGLTDAAKAIAEQIDKVAPGETFTDAATVLEGTTPVLVRQGNRGTLTRLPYSPTPRIEKVDTGTGVSIVDANNPALPTLRGFTKSPEVPSDVREAMILTGIPVTTNPDLLTPEQRRVITGRIDASNASKAPRTAVDLRDPTAVVRAQAELFKEFQGQLKSSGDPEIAARYRSVLEAASQANAGNAQADGALIYAIGKIYDPSGAVQEGDKATILGSRSIPEEIKAAAQKLFTGGSFTPAERANLVRVATAVVRSRQQATERLVSTYQQYSQGLGGTGREFSSPYDGIQYPSVMIGSGSAQPAQPSLPMLPGLRDAERPTPKPLGEIFRSLPQRP